MIIGVDARPLAQKKLTGTAEYTQGILRALLEIDDKNEYHLFFNSFSDVAFPEFPQENVKIISSQIPNKIFNLPMQKILKHPQIDKKIKADLFFQPNIGFIALSKSVKKILTIHDLSFLRYPEFFSKKMLAWHRIVNAKKQVMEADKIIAVSQSTKDDLRDLFSVSDKKISVIHSGINDDLEIVSPEESEGIREKYGLPKKFFLSLSTLEPRKNIDGIIKAFDLYVEKTGNREHLVIAGTQGWKSGDIFAEYRKAKNKNQINFIGYVDASEKKYLYSLTQALIYVSYYEGFGFPPIEALACGCPVIVSENSSLAEICGKEAIFVKANKTSELVKALEFLAQSNDSQEKKVQISNKIKEKYCWQKSAQAHLELFESF